MKRKSKDQRKAGDDDDGIYSSLAYVAAAASSMSRPALESRKSYSMHVYISIESKQAEAAPG